MHDSTSVASRLVGIFGGKSSLGVALVRPAEG
jgi:hypothetical protein